jgi:uncharacterized glyoxalase superfamily protein PhnB
MPRDAVPMLNVPDVAATAAWYQALGFELMETAEDEGRVTWASLRFGEGQVMLNAGGSPAGGGRRDVDLFCYVSDADAWFAEVGDQGRLVEGLHDTFYGLREFTIRDPNGFWLTFASPLPPGEQQQQL